MKHQIRIFCFVYFCFISFNHAQEHPENPDEDKSFPELFFDAIDAYPIIDVRLISPYAFGDHFLSQAYKQDVAGLDLFINAYAIQNFRIGLGHTRFGSSLTNAALAGNFESTSYRSYYLQIDYAFLQYEEIEVGVSLGYGINYFKQYTSGVRRGNYDTGELRSGIYSRYQFATNFGISLGVNYLTTNPSVNSASQSGKLFGRTHVLSPFFGIYFNP